MALEEPELRAMFEGIENAYGTHRPALCEAVVRTTGPILELGMGDSSTRSLHEVAEGFGRLVCSYDHDSSWVDRYVGLRTDQHRIECVESWDQCPIESTRWGVAFVDHAPRERRAVDIVRLADRAEVIVIHDSEDPSYRYDLIFGAFKYRLDDRSVSPWTTLLSNYVDVSSWSLKGASLVAAPVTRQLRTSLIIPCAGKHVALLPELLATLREQTRAPDEIVIAASGVAVTDLADVDAQIVYSPTPLTAGANRNRGTDVASGDIFIYQDADDLPHPQRVEIIAGLFEQFAIDHLMHFFYYLDGEAKPVSIEDAAKRSTYCSKLMKEVAYRKGLVEYVTNGNVSVTRDLARAVYWPEHPRVGEDQEFNRAIYKLTKRTVVTPLPLITYRHNFSTFC